MKNYILILSTLLLSNITYSQEYFPLVEENKTWYVISSFFGGNERTYIHKCEGDTLIEGKNYKTVYVTTEEFPVNWTKKGYIREDEDKKVYYSQFFSNNPTYFIPLLLYDFDAEINDTITVFPPEFSDSLEIIIAQKDSVLVDGKYRPRTWFECEQFIDNYWIEGIGSNSGLLDIGFYCMVVCPGLDLGCVKQDDITIYPDGFTGDCYIVGIDEPETEKLLFDIYPNPTSDYLYISPKLNSQSKLLFELNNSMGMKVIQIKLNSNYPTQINVRELESGLYLYSISNENIAVQNGKIVIQ